MAKTKNQHQLTETELATLANVDPVGASTLQKLNAGTPVHKLGAAENEVVRLAWIADQFPRQHSH